MPGTSSRLIREVAEKAIPGDFRQVFGEHVGQVFFGGYPRDGDNTCCVTAQRT
jgi:hypothetical protein